MAKVIIDIEMIATLEQRSYCKLSPAERIIVAYVHNFKQGFYGSCVHLSKICGLSVRQIGTLVRRLQKRKILIEERKTLILNPLYRN
jgi:hypothetical protein